MKYERMKVVVIGGSSGIGHEVASTYLHLMTNGFITGQTVAVDGGMTMGA